MKLSLRVSYNGQSSVMELGAILFALQQEFFNEQIKID
jgi:hypothetical protein